MVMTRVSIDKINEKYRKIAIDAKSQLETLKENLETVLNEVRKSKPSSSKGVYMQTISLSTTMGPGLLIDKSSITALS